MNQELSATIQLQSLDVRIAELKAEIALLPKQIAEIEKALVGHLRQLEADKAALAANQKERKRLDAEVASQQGKISKLRDQMLQAKTNEQYRAFQKEIEFCEQSIRKAEDQTLDLMGEGESLEKNVKVAEKALAEEKKVVEGEKVRAKQRSDADKAELAKVSAERAEVAAKVPAALLASYDRLRTRYYKDGDVIAEAKDATCQKCWMVLRPQFFQEVKVGEKVHFCENCRRILFYEEPAVDVQANMELP